jgi:hypothetical protein
MPEEALEILRRRSGSVSTLPVVEDADLGGWGAE